MVINRFQLGLGGSILYFSIMTVRSAMYYVDRVGVSTNQVAMARWLGVHT